MTGRRELELRAAAEFLTPDLSLEVYRLYDVELAHNAATVEIAELRRQLHRAQALAGDLRGQVATHQARLAELCPPEIAQARHDALFTGAGYFRVVSLGRQRYAAERIPPEQVILRGQ